VPVVASVAGTPTTIHCDGSVAAGGSAAAGAASDNINTTSPIKLAILVSALTDFTSRS
jgi:hypothetical protein